MLISGRFPLIRSQNQKPMVLMVSMCPKTLNWYLGSSYMETIGFQRPAQKKGLFILRNTLFALKYKSIKKNSNITYIITQALYMFYAKFSWVGVLVSVHWKFRTKRLQKPSSLHQIILTAPKLQGKGFSQNTILASTYCSPSKCPGPEKRNKGRSKKGRI